MVPQPRVYRHGCGRLACWGVPGNMHVKGVCGGCYPEAVWSASAGRGLFPASAGEQEAVA